MNLFFILIKSFSELSAQSINEDTSAIQFVTITHSNLIKDNWNQVVKNVNELGVKRLHVHINDSDCMAEINHILYSLDYSRVTNISFSMPYQKVDKKLYKNNRLKTVYLLTHPKQR